MAYLPDFQFIIPFRRIVRQKDSLPVDRTVSVHLSGEYCQTSSETYFYKMFNNVMTTSKSIANNHDTETETGMLVCDMKRHIPLFF